MLQDHRRGNHDGQSQLPPPTYKDVALHTQLLVLTAQPGQLLALGCAQAVALLLPTALLSVSLNDPVADRLGGRLELARQVSRVAAGADQINDLPPELRRVSPNNSSDRPKSAQATKHLGQRFHCKKLHQTARSHSCER